MANAFDTIRERHHAKAKLVAAGHSTSSIANMLGTSASQLERLIRDPAFRDLVARYRRMDLTNNANQRHQLNAYSAKSGGAGGGGGTAAE